MVESKVEEYKRNIEKKGSYRIEEKRKKEEAMKTVARKVTP